MFEQMPALDVAHALPKANITPQEDVHWHISS
jgi:hypothetical protein